MFARFTVPIPGTDVHGLAPSRLSPLPAPPARNAANGKRQRKEQGNPARTMAPDKSYLAGINPYADLETMRRSLAKQFDKSPDVLPSYQDASIKKANDCPCEDEDHPSKGWKLQAHHLAKEQLWQQIRTEAKQDAADEPALASFLHSTILVHQNIERTLAFLLANKLANATMLSTQLMRLIQDAYQEDPTLIEAACADMQAVYDRDPACDKYTQCMLYFKGFQAVQCHRIAHWLWNKGRKALALAIQSRVSEAFHVDIHPAARLGRGVLIDHATGVVIGETAVVGDNVSMLHHVTLGGSGTGKGIRHPIIGNGVLLGAGVSVLGPITVGAGSKVGAGSVVVTDLPCHCVAVGVPAKIVKRNLTKEPVKDMDQCIDFILDYVI